MRKILLLMAGIAICTAAMAQSKSELKEQMDALATEMRNMRKADSLTIVQYQNKVQQLEENMSMLRQLTESQSKAMQDYAAQVQLLNQEITTMKQVELANKTNTVDKESNERIVIIKNSQDNTFTVPAGKTWLIYGKRLKNYLYDHDPDMYITKWNGTTLRHKDGRLGIYICNDVASCDAIPENTTIQLKVGYWNRDANRMEFPNDYEGYVCIKEIDNK